MTLHATRKDDSITVHATYGTARFEITEQAGHIGHFWHDLGQLLQEHEKPVPYVEVVELPENREM